MRAILAAVLALAMLAAASPAAAQATRPDPAAYLPTPEEIPPGFVQRPGGAGPADGPGVSSLLRWYERPIPEAGPGVTTLLGVFAQVADSAEAAEEVTRATVAMWEAGGVRFEPLPGIGEQAVLGRMPVTVGGARPGEAVFIYFRLGNFAGGALWGDAREVPAAENALAMARLIEAKMAAGAGLPAPHQLPPPAQPAPGPPSGSDRAAPDSKWPCPGTHPIEDNRQSMIYRLPGGQFYGRTKPEDCFSTEQGARAAGYRRSLR